MNKVGVEITIERQVPTEIDGAAEFFDNENDALQR